MCLRRIRGSFNNALSDQGPVSSPKGLTGFR